MFRREEKRRGARSGEEWVYKQGEMAGGGGTLCRGESLVRLQLCQESIWDSGVPHQVPHWTPKDLQATKPTGSSYMSHVP